MSSTLWVAFGHFLLTVVLISLLPIRSDPATTMDIAISRLVFILHFPSQLLGHLVPFSDFGAILGMALFIFDSLLWGFAVAWVILRILAARI